jgi:hypothetical protein
MVFSAIPTDMDAVCSAMMRREIKEEPAKIDAAVLPIWASRILFQRR